MSLSQARSSASVDVSCRPTIRARRALGALRCPGPQHAEIVKAGAAPRPSVRRQRHPVRASRGDDHRNTRSQHPLDARRDRTRQIAGAGALHYQAVDAPLQVPVEHIGLHAGVGLHQRHLSTDAAASRGARGVERKDRILGLHRPDRGPLDRLERVHMEGVELGDPGRAMDAVVDAEQHSPGAGHRADRNEEGVQEVPRPVGAGLETRSHGAREHDRAVNGGIAGQHLRHVHRLFDGVGAVGDDHPVDFA